MLRVFPTETIARSFLTHYARTHKEQTFWNDDFISWDTFKNLCTELPSGRKAGYADRLIFADSFIHSRKTKDLKYFFNPKYPESAEGFAKEIATCLPSFQKALLSTSPMPAALRNDMDVLLTAYTQNLKERGLYQDTFLVPDFSKAPENTEVYFSDSLSDTDANILKSGVSSGTLKQIRLIENLNSMAPLTVFPNTMAEIRWVMRSVRQLLLEGVPAREIVISTTNIKEVFPYLEEEASIRNIPLNILQGQTLDTYPAGRFFSLLNKLVSGDYSMDGMKAFLLNPSFPFNQKETTVSIIRNGIDLGILQGGKGSSNWIYRLRASKLELEAEYIKTLADLAGRIVHAKDVENFKIAVRRFQNAFFTNGSWDSMNSTIDSAAFQRCMEIAEEIEEAGYTGAEPFQMILYVMKKTIYEPQKEGIAVFVIPYPLSAGLRVKHHFVMGLDDASTRIKRTPVPFDAENQDSTDVGDAVLSAYSYEPEDLHLTCSIETYHGTASVPSVFIQNKNFEYYDEVPSDSFIAENFSWKNKKPVGVCTWLQKEAFEKAKTTTLDHSSIETIETKNVKINLSATSIDTFGTCPFQYLMKYGLGLERVDYEVQMEDHLEIGNLLHRAYERYFEDIRSFKEGEKEENLPKLKQYFVEEVNNYSKKPDGPDPLFKQRLIQQFQEGLSMIFFAPAAKNYKDNGADLVQTEKHFSFDFEGYQITGSIDALFKTPSGEFLLIDFKKGTTCNKRQLYIYSKALENDSNISQAASIGGFYSISKRNYMSMVDSKDEFVMESGHLDDEMKNMIQSIQNGNFPLTENPENCKNCDFRRICRRGYVIK